MSEEKPQSLTIRNSTVEFLIFTQEAGEDDIEVRLVDESIWLTQKLMAELFSVDVRTVSEHLKNIFDSDELQPDSVIRKFRTTASDGKNYNTQFYNLDAIISIGYRVNSRRATQFRQWATGVLRQFAVRGYVMDKKRLENGTSLGVDYFEHLLEEIREIRLSERHFYQKLTDIYALSVDYNTASPTTRTFFAKVQNKLHFAIHGNTASELIKKRADSSKPRMGLTTWASGPKGKILKSDVETAKNYLSPEELNSLGRIVNSYLDLAEDHAKRGIPMTTEGWVTKLDEFLGIYGLGKLRGAGSVSTRDGKGYAASEFEKYRIIQDRQFESDFDKEAKAIAQQVVDKKKKGKKKDE